MSVSAFTSASLMPQSPEMSIFDTAPRQPCVSSNCTRPCVRVWRANCCSLGSRVVRLTNRQAAFIEFLLAVSLVQLPPHFLGEVFSGEDLHARRLGGDAKRRALGLIGVG